MSVFKITKVKFDHAWIDEVGYGVRKEPITKVEGVETVTGKKIKAEFFGHDPSLTKAHGALEQKFQEFLSTQQAKKEQQELKATAKSMIGCKVGTQN